jgi:flavin reductase (DIM6/NTAB) family NADH-FMN oxidoreductase RutF
MTKINIELGKRPPAILSASPTVIVGTVVEGKLDFVTVAAVGIAANNPPALGIALQPHRHSLRGIRQNMTFSVNIPSADQVKETDYCGIVSGSKADKAKDCRFQIFYGKLATAPLIQQCPINHACEVVQIVNLGSHYFIIGRIVETLVSEDCISGGRLDNSKIKPFFLAAGKYCQLGNFLAEPFKVGNEIRPI